MMGATLFSGIGVPEMAALVMRWILDRVQLADSLMEAA